MTRKTATIRIRPIFGCKSDCADISYRGVILKSFEGNNMAQKLCYMSRKWAHENGFTHTKVQFG